MRVAKVLRGIGETLITAGLVVLLFVVYELYITDLFNAHTQHRLHQTIEKDWARHAGNVGLDTPPLGDGLAILRIPKFGRGYDPVIVEGVATADLEKGPGHYPGSALPGGVGNFVVSGHRTTYGKPFSRLDELGKGDAIVIETRDRWITYRVTETLIVDPGAVGVILPVPDHPGDTPTQKLLTFTTCNPRYSAAQRLIVHAVMMANTAKADGVPTVLSQS